MLNQSYKKYETVPFAVNLVVLLAFVGLLITAGQVGLIIFKGDILCLNDGCAIVESLTRVPPIIFNLAGFFYFFVVFYCFKSGRGGSRFWLKSGRILLLGGMAAEGVLVAFQHYIAQAFCSYCLIILGIICLLNLLVGLKQLFAGLFIFGSVLLAFSSLQFSATTSPSSPVLKEGTFGYLERENNSAEMYLFFSATCPHCEDVIATIDDQFSCSLNFNPVSEIETMTLEGVEHSISYSPEVNKSFLINMGITEIPVLAVRSENGLQILKGKNAILDFLNSSCRANNFAGQENIESGAEVSGMSVGQQPLYTPYGAQPDQEESCGLEVDCEPEPQPQDTGQ